MRRVVVIGAGVAGSIVAARLADQFDVVVVESGSAGSTPTDPRLALSSESDVERTPYPRGRGVGGGSRINGMVLEHAPPAFWARLALRLGERALVERVDMAMEEVAGGEQATRFGSVDRALLEAHPSARPVRLMTRGSERTNAWDLAAARKHVDLRTESVAERLVVRGDRVTAVALADGNEIPADHVILCAGAIGSPVLARRSGVGGNEVGRHLLDHPAVFIPVGSIGEGNEEPFSGSIVIDQGLLILAINGDARAQGGLLLGVMDAVAEGEVGIATNSVAVDRGLLGVDSDRVAMRRGVEMVRELVTSDAFGRLGPIDHRSLEESSWAPTVGEGMWHAAGTMRMGRGEDAVVDPDGRLRGTSNLWCMDASVFPTIPPVPLQSATMVMASVLADQFVSLSTT